MPFSHFRREYPNNKKIVRNGLFGGPNSFWPPFSVTVDEPRFVARRRDGVMNKEKRTRRRPSSSQHGHVQDLSSSDEPSAQGNGQGRESCLVAKQALHT